jgi:hypothetical protein
MSTQLTRLVSPGFGLAIAAALALAACNRGEAPKTPTAAAAEPAPANAQLAWARAALERNPELEVVAADPQSGVVTIKHRGTGEVETVKASELAAVSPSQLKAMNSIPAPEPQPEPAPSQNERATSPQQSAQATAPDRGEGNAPVPGATPSGYKVERENGQIRVSGPGVSIVSSGSNASAGSQASGGRKPVDPFICEGRRTLQLDNRNIYVEGDAITVRDGCELFLTNSHIIASGTGIVVQDATVHISNSTVEGASASFQVDDHSKMYVRGSTFQGVPRRAELAMVQDQGGNRWR